MGLVFVTRRNVCRVLLLGGAVVAVGGLVTGLLGRGAPRGGAPVARADLPHRTLLPLVVRSFTDRTGSNATAFGVEVVGGIAGESTKRARVLDLGVSWVRRNRVSWAAIQPVRDGPFDFSRTDADLAAIGASGLSPIVVVADNPSWAGGGNGPLADADLPRFAQFMAALVSRYKQPPHHVKYWELYNEPDNLVGGTIEQAQGGRWGGNGAQYAKMLQAVYPAIKAADPSAVVVFGGLALDYFQTGNGTFEADPGGRFDPNFLEDVLANGGGTFFDVMNFHYYPEYDWRWNRIGQANGYGPAIAGKAGYIRSVLARFGLQKPIICTEIGISSAPDRPAQPSPTAVDRSTPTSPSSETEQSRFVVRTLARALAQQVAIVVWYPLVDAGPPGISRVQDFFAYHGLLDYLLNPKPAFAVYQQAAKQLAGAQFIKRGGLVDFGTAAVEGYLFQLPSGEHQWVLWSTADQPTAVTLVARSATVFSPSGQLMTSVVAPPGLGYVTLSVGADPVYVMLGP
jgi:hypothetical protein